MATIPVEPTKGTRPGPILAAALAVAVLAIVALWWFRPTADTPAPAPAAPAEPAPAGFLDGGAGFAVKAGNLAIPYTVFGVYVMPGDTLLLEALFVEGEAEAEAEAGQLEQTGPRAWRWAAPPTPGLTKLRVTNASDEVITLHAFTLVPFDHRSSAIGDYTIGTYRDKPLGGNPAYNPPPGFVRVTPELADVAVSPHFTLGQFLAKQAAGWPKYLILNERLLLKLERILTAINQAGVEAQTLSVLSGFRTPAYNASIGNETSYSRHVYGDAADVFVDADGDGMMDDLNGDGSVTRADAEWMAAIVDGLAEQPWYQPFVGGLGIYGPAPHRGPFIHVDTRGQAVRW